MKLNSILFLLLCNSGLQSQTFEYLDDPNFNSIMEQEVVKKFDKIRSTYDPDVEARDYVMDGIVVTAKGKWMDPDCVAKPKVVHVRVLYISLKNISNRCLLILRFLPATTVLNQ